MNRPRIVSMLSAALGSTTGFLILSRWSLAGTITGAILMPVIFTLVSFGSHETLERFNGWLARRLRRGKAESKTETAPTDKADIDKTEEPSAGTVTPRARGLQWAVAILALLAFSFSLYSVTQGDSAGFTILREKVIETVTVTSEQPPLSVARSTSGETTETTDLSAELPTTTSTTGQDDLPTTTVSTSVVPDDSTTTTLP